MKSKPSYKPFTKGSATMTLVKINKSTSSCGRSGIKGPDTSERLEMLVKKQK